MRARAGQNGLSLFGLILVLVGFGLCAVLVMKVFPSLVEYRAIQSATRKAASQGSSALEVQRSFDRNAVIDDITSIGGKDLDIEKDEGRFVVSFSYTTKIPLFGPVSLLIDYAGTSKGT